MIHLPSQVEPSEERILLPAHAVQVVTPLLTLQVVQSEMMFAQAKIYHFIYYFIFHFNQELLTKNFNKNSNKRRAEPTKTSGNIRFNDKIKILLCNMTLIYF